MSSRGSRTTSYVESADVKIEVQSTRPTPKSRTSNLFKSLGARAREKAGSEKLKRDLSPVPSTTPGNNPVIFCCCHFVCHYCDDVENRQIKI